MLEKESVKLRVASVKTTEFFVQKVLKKIIGWAAVANCILRSLYYHQNLFRSSCSAQFTDHERKN